MKDDLEKERGEDIPLVCQKHPGNQILGSTLLCSSGEEGRGRETSGEREGGGKEREERDGKGREGKLQERAKGKGRKRIFEEQKKGRGGEEGRREKRIRGKEGIGFQTVLFHLKCHKTFHVRGLPFGKRLHFSPNKLFIWRRNGKITEFSRHLFFSPSGPSILKKS